MVLSAKEKELVGLAEQIGKCTQLFKINQNKLADLIGNNSPLSGQEKAQTIDNLEFLSECLETFLGKIEVVAFQAAAALNESRDNQDSQT